MTSSWSGYSGSVDHIEDAIRAPYQGSTVPTVATSDAMKVTANNTATLSVNVAGGVSWAYQVKASLDPTSVAFDAVTSTGLSRWDAVVVRRNWSAKTVAVVAVPGVAAQNAPQVVPTLANTPGTIHEQLLALVQITNGSPVPTAIADRRLYAHKTIYAPEVAALPAAEPRLFGLEARLPSGTRYLCQLNASNIPSWVAVDALVELSQSGILGSEPGWSAGGLAIRALYSDLTGEVQVDVLERRTGTSIVPAASGNFDDTLICTLKPPLWPQRTIPIFGQYAAGSGYAWLPFSGSLGTDGRLTLQSGVGGQSLLPRAGSGASGAVTANDISLRTHIRFTRKA